jgi:hypothetical protein
MTGNESFSLGDRFEFGNLHIAEVIALKGTSRSTFYRDVKGGRVEIKKLGRSSVVPGASARRYIMGSDAVGRRSTGTSGLGF